MRPPTTPLSSGTTPVLFNLPICRYPTARDIDERGVQRLPPTLPLADLSRASGLRTRRFTLAPLSELPSERVLETARVVSASFSKREPQTRHIRPPRDPSPGVIGSSVRDEFGEELFGPWTKESLFYWFVRLMVLTDPSSPRASIHTNHESLEQSIAMLDADGRVLGGAFNETLPRMDAPPSFRSDDPILAASFGFVEPVLTRLLEQDAEAVAALSATYPLFRSAYEAGRVGHHFMVARGDEITGRDAFDLVAGSAERYVQLGFDFMVVEATNQWTGAACEALGAVRVHFRPFRDRQAVAMCAAALPDAVSSPDGFIADKNSGSMFYVLRLR